MADPYAGVEYFPQSLPINTVVGRLGNVPGPAEAIPFATLAKYLVPGVFATTSLLLSTYPGSVADGQTAQTFGRTALGDHGGGQFQYVASDTTTADNGGTIRVDNAGHRWYYISPAPVSPELFGAKGDGVTDDTLALTKMVAVGGYVQWRAATYAYTNLAISVPFRWNGALESKGSVRTRLLSIAADNTNKITLGNGSIQFESPVIEHFIMDAPTATGGAVIYYNWVADATMRDVQMVSIGASARGIMFRRCNTLRFYDIRIINPVTSGIYGFGGDTERSDDIELINIIISGDSTGAATHLPNALELNGFVNTVSGHHLNFVTCGRGLYCHNAIATTNRAEYINIYDIEIDYPYYEGILINYHDGVFMSDVYVHNSITTDNIVINTASPNTVSNISIMGGQCTSAAHYGMQLDGRYIRVMGMLVTGNSRAVSTTYPGVRIGANSIGVTLVGNTIGQETGFIGSLQSYGVIIENGALEYNVTGNNLTGNAAGPLHDNAAIAGGAITSHSEAQTMPNVGQIGQQAMVTNAPTDGFSITFGTNQYLHLLPAGTLATGTITLPNDPVHGQEAHVFSTQIITALTLAAGSGDTISSGSEITTIAAAKTGFSHKYNASNAKWYRIR